MNANEYLLYLLTHYRQLIAECQQVTLLSESVEKTLLLARTQELERLKLALCGVDPKYRSILQDLYFHQETWQRVCDKHHICIKTVSQYRKKGLAQLLNIWELKGLKSLSLEQCLSHDSRR